jgi:hypothetical protein
LPVAPSTCRSEALTLSEAVAFHVEMSSKPSSSFASCACACAGNVATSTNSDIKHFCNMVGTFLA